MHYFRGFPAESGEHVGQLLIDTLTPLAAEAARHSRARSPHYDHGQPSAWTDSGRLSAAPGSVRGSRGGPVPVHHGGPDRHQAQIPHPGPDAVEFGQSSQMSPVSVMVADPCRVRSCLAVPVIVVILLSW